MEMGFRRRVGHRLRTLASLVSPFVPHDLRIVSSIEGHLAFAEAQLLYELASQVTSGCILEVGSYRGKSTAA